MKIRILLYSFVFLSGFIFSKTQFEEKDILNVDEAFVVNTLIEKNKILISWDIKPGYYLYKKSILIKAGDDSLIHNYLIMLNMRLLQSFKTP